MRGFMGVVVGLGLLAIGLAGLGYSLHVMMNHADADANMHAAAGLVVFVLGCLASLRVIR